MYALFTFRSTVRASSASIPANNGSNPRASINRQNMEEKPRGTSAVRPPATQIDNSVTSRLSKLLPNPHQTPSQRIRPRQGTDPLRETVRARLRGDHNMSCSYGSSGSDHDPDSVCLADMVCGFMEEEDNKAGNCGRSHCRCSNGSGEPCSDEDNMTEEGELLPLENVSQDSSSNVHGDLIDVLEGLVACMSNPLESLLLGEVTRALKKENGEDPCNKEEIKDRKSWLRRSVMKHLRGLGYNAGICKSRWEHIGGFPSGDYEYIDVLIDGEDRFLVDIDFRGQFEIARPTAQYDGLLQILPNVFVGKAGRLKHIIRIMCNSAKRSLKKKEMHLPPWRKNRYMEAKWFGPYKRTTNPTGTCNKQPLVTDLGSLAFKRTGWDDGFTDQLELHYEGTKEKLVTSETSSAEEIELAATGWKPSAITPKLVSTARQSKSSGLSSALNGAGSTCLFRSPNSVHQ